MVVVQVSVDACPVRIEAGFAAKLTVGGTWLTVTVADAVAVAPFCPVTVATYVVVRSGLTGSWPCNANGPGSS